MKTFTAPIGALKEITDCKEVLAKKKGLVQLSGIMDAGKAHLIHTISEKAQPTLIVTSKEQRAKELEEELRFFDRDACYYPAKDLLFYQSDIHGNLLAKERIRVLKRLCEEKCPTVITTMDALMNLSADAEGFVQSILKLRVGDTLEQEKLVRGLTELGYFRETQVEAAGEFAVRGGIVDVFPLVDENPIRIEFWGDEIDSIRRFEAESQRSIENMEEADIYPACECVITKETVRAGVKKMKSDAKKLSEKFRSEMKTEEAHRLKQTVSDACECIVELETAEKLEDYLPYFMEETKSILDFFPAKQSLLFLDEPLRIAEKGRVVETEFCAAMEQRLEKGYILPKQMKLLIPYKEILARLSSYRGVILCALETSVKEFPYQEHFFIQMKGVSSYNKSFELLVKDLKHYKKNGYRIVLLSGSKTRAEHLAKDLMNEGLNVFFSEDYDHEIKAGEIMTAYGKIKHGYEYPLAKFAVISESDIFGAEKKKKKRRIYEGDKIQSFRDLHVGDYVVHENHGLGIYRGIEKIEIEKTTRDYIKIEYAGGSNLYILATQLDLIQKYAGADAKKPKLNQLGGAEWNKTKTKVRGAVKEIARELVDLYAIRQNKEGYEYGPDTVWQKEFEEMFPFEETEDQELAIEATKRDMESKKIMDRLICGDVGYGKTEIAIRAAFKAVQEGKQVVYLVPTTILATQHYHTFSERMKEFPVRVDLLCRFRTPAEQKKTLADLKTGQVDIVIGTHRLLSKDVVYKDLGLLVIDEEQRFGVTHKERIKQLKKDVDVLTLTATPIPRTLHMSLIGIRDMSVLEEPPMDRVPIQTYVMEYSEEMVREAIERELARNGQVYYVFNRVRQIADMTAHIASLVPNATVEYAHGQMKERDLEDIMYRFINGEIDVLVSTTIIETGMDISNVNTMIIQDADRMGLSQLYQLRGRVGRSNRTAYAFFMYKKDKMLKEVAEKRLSAIREFTDLGSGFKIAMRDLEIRGAGNLLGAQQHGHMEAVGYDLYCKLLNEAVKEEKGEKPAASYETSLDLVVDAFIPSDYIPNEMQKMDVYKRIAGITELHEAEDMLEELIDRFGEPPKSVQNLIHVARLKARAHKDYFTNILQRDAQIRFVLYERADLHPEKIPEFVGHYEGTLQFIADAKQPAFLFLEGKNSKWKIKNVPDFVEDFLEDVERTLL